MARKKKASIADAIEASAKATRPGRKPNAVQAVELAEEVGPIDLDQIGELECRLRKAEAEHLALLDSGGVGFVYEEKVAMAEHRCWRLRAQILFFRGKHSEAFQASKTAEGLASQAAKLEQASLGDRVLELERRIAATREAGHALAGLREVED